MAQTNILTMNSHNVTLGNGETDTSTEKKDMSCVDFYKNFETFLSLWLLNWPGGRVDWSGGVPGGLGLAEHDGYYRISSF